MTVITSEHLWNYNNNMWYVKNAHTYHYRLIHTYIRTYIHTYVHTYIHTYIHTYVHTYIRTYVHTYIHTYIRTYIHTYIHTYIRTYVHTYIHTYRLAITPVLLCNICMLYIPNTQLNSALFIDNHSLHIWTILE